MKRKDYERPAMKVVEVKHHRMLMTSNLKSATMTVTYDEEDI